MPYSQVVQSYLKRTTAQVNSPLGLRSQDLVDPKLFHTLADRLRPVNARAAMFVVFAKETHDQGRPYDSIVQLMVALDQLTRQSGPLSNAFAGEGADRSDACER